MKKIIIAIAALTAAAGILLAGCGKGGAGQQNSGTGENAGANAGTGAGSERGSIMRENNVHMDEVVTEGFSLPDRTEEKKDEFQLPVFFSDGCVLQADMAVRLWGRAAADGEIAVRVTEDGGGYSRTFYGKTENGEFELFIEGPDPGGPFTVEFINEKGYTYTLTNVLFGEVFVLGGQSNMGWAMGQCYDGSTDKMLYEDIMDTCYDDKLREMLVWPVSSKTPVEWLDSCRQWREISRQSIKEMSAVGYFFGRRMRSVLKNITGNDVPVGLVAACMGGTPISEWVVGGSWYNGQVNPIKKMTVRGVVWYQGEGDYVKYSDRLAALIAEWRREFDNPGLLWAAVQLPRYVNEDSYYQCREEVKKTKLLTEDYTYCVTVDTGLYPEFKAEGDTLNDDGIHPYEKQPVGTRLADAVIAEFTDAEGLWTAPYAVRAEKAPADGEASEAGTAVKITFENTGAGLVLDGLAGFEMAGADGKYYDATPALVSEDEVTLTCDKVEDPVSVRYGYKNYSSLADKITKCSDSVCVYSTYDENATNIPEYAEKTDGAYKAYPAEQFTLTVE